MKKNNIEQQINSFLEIWDVDTMTSFIKHIISLCELYNVEEDDDWVKDAVGIDNERNVRLIRTVYIMSRIAEFYSGKLCNTKMQFKDLWKKMEKFGVIEVE